MLLRIAITLIIILSSFSLAYPAQLGHYTPDAKDVRDGIMPDNKGFSLTVYNRYYASDTFRGPAGRKFDSLSASGSAKENIKIMDKLLPVTLTGNASAYLDIEFNQFMQLLELTWVPDVKLLGADYAFLITPQWGYSHFKAKAEANASCSISFGSISRTLSANSASFVKEDNSGFGDLYVQPLWLAWRNRYFDAGLSYGLYSPTGYYNNDGLANIGLGYWTQQIQSNLYYFPFANQDTALVIRPTFEWNSRKVDTNVRPGHMITFEYGVSQSIFKDLEIAALGYNTIQLKGDRGADSADDGPMSYTAGAGLSMKYGIIKDKLFASFKYNREYQTKYNFEGDTWLFDIKLDF